MTNFEFILLQIRKIDQAIKSIGTELVDVVKIATPQIKVILKDARACVLDVVTIIRGQIEGIVNTINSCVNSIGPKSIT